MSEAHIPGTSCVLAVSASPSYCYYICYCHFSLLCHVIQVPLAQTVLDGLNPIFLEGEGEASMGKYVLGFMVFFMIVVLWLLLNFYGINIFYCSIFKSKFCS
jgi:hypothetical protein